MSIGPWPGKASEMRSLTKGVSEHDLGRIRADSAGRFTWDLDATRAADRLSDVCMLTLGVGAAAFPLPAIASWTMPESADDAGPAAQHRRWLSVW